MKMNIFQNTWSPAKRFTKFVLHLCLQNFQFLKDVKLIDQLKKC
jgi:hypothetical protein